MKYLKLRISTEQRGLLFEKDVRVRNVFYEFVRLQVADLVRAGILNQGELYSATVIPRYGDWVPLRWTAPPPVGPAQQADEEQKTWIEMRFDEPARPDAPVPFFAIELHMYDRDLVLGNQFLTGDIATDYVKHGVERALLGFGVLSDGEYYRRQLFARDDNEADFDRERIPTLQESAAQLVDLSPETEQPQFPQRDPAAYPNLQHVGTAAPGDIRILLSRSTLERLVTEAKASRDVERGGMLVGQVYEDVRGGRPFVEISDLVVSEHALASVSELHSTFATWHARETQMRERFPGKILVGWYHTHLVAIPGRNAAEATRLFFSESDLFLHKKFFAEPWYVALVLDPDGNRIFFQWKDGDIAVCDGYALFDNPPAASPDFS